MTGAKYDGALRLLVHITVLFLLSNTSSLQAATPPCGTTLGKNTKLDSDMICSGTALRFDGKKSKKVTLNCNGHSITTTNGTAIVASSVTSVTIRNCNIMTSGTFTHGILFTGGTKKSQIKDNIINTSGISARGIELRDSSSNKITDNRIHTTGDGANAIRIRAGANNNQIKGNLLQADAAHTLNIQSSNNSKIEKNTLLSPQGYVLQRSLSLQNGGLGIDSSGNIYAVDNNWGSRNGIGTATAFFVVDPLTGLGGSVLPLLTGGNDIGLGFDALDVLPNGSIRALRGGGGTAELYEINPISGEVTSTPLNIISGSGNLNGLEATSNTSMLATTNSGGLLNIDLTTSNVTEIGKQTTGWTDVAVHPSNGKVYTVSRWSDEASQTSHLYEINPATGQIVTEIGDTGKAFLSGIDFSPGGILYGNDSGLFTIDTGDASVTVVSSSFGPDPLEPRPRKNKLEGNLIQTASGSIRFLNGITLPAEIETDISTERVEIVANEVKVDSVELPFLDKKARITLENLGGTYRNLLVDPEDDGSFEACESPQCKFVSFDGGDLVFDVNGFSSYSSAENSDPTLEFVTRAVRANIRAISSGVSKKSIEKRLKAADKDFVKALKLLGKDDIKKGLDQISRAVTDLIKAENKVAAVGGNIDLLVDAARDEAQAAIDAAMAASGNAADIAGAQENMTEAQEQLNQDKPDKAIGLYRKARDKALKATSGGGGNGGSGLTVTVLDNPVSRTPIEGAYVVLYRPNNVAIDQVKRTGSNGRASFATSRDRVSVTVAFNEFSVAEIWTAIDIQPRPLIFYADEELCEGELGRFDATVTGISGDATRATLDPFRFIASSGEGSKAVSAVSSGSAAFSGVQICNGALQSDDKLSALLLATDDAQNLQSYGFATDFDVGQNLVIDGGMTPSDLNWSSPPSVAPSLINLTAIRKGIPYPFGVGLSFGASSGSLPIIDQFPADSFQVSSYFTKQSGSSCQRTRTYASPPSNLTIDFIDTDFTAVDYAAASDRVSWTRTGSMGDAINIDLTYLNGNDSAVWVINRSSAGQQMQVLPDLPGAVETWLQGRDGFDDLSVAAYDTADANGFDEYFDSIVDGIDVNLPFTDLDSCSCSIGSCDDGGGTSGGSLALTGTGVGLLPSSEFTPSSVEENAGGAITSISWTTPGLGPSLVVSLFNSIPIGVTLTSFDLATASINSWNIVDSNGVPGLTVGIDTVSFGDVILVSDDDGTTVVLNGTIER